LRSEWRLKSDPVHQPVRFLAGVWEQRTGVQLTSKELGQLRDLRKALGEFTRDVIEWMLDPVHWWRFCQQVRAESGLHSAPPYPHVGFLLKHHGRALKYLRVELHQSSVEVHVSFCTRLDRLRFEQLKTFLLATGAATPEWQARVNAAQTLTDLQRVFIDLSDETTAAST
jgi:hypothetical protein